MSFNGIYYNFGISTFSFKSNITLDNLMSNIKAIIFDLVSINLLEELIFINNTFVNDSKKGM